MLWINRGKGFTDYTSPYHFKHFSGFVKVSPATALILGMFLFSLAGLPPFSLFWAKMYLIGSAINADQIALAIIIVINSVIAAFYYLRPVGAMFLKDPMNYKKRVYVKCDKCYNRSIIVFSCYSFNKSHIIS